MKTRKLLGTLIIISISLACSLFIILSSNQEPSVKNQIEGVFLNDEAEYKDENSEENQEGFEEYENSGFYKLDEIPYQTLQLCPPEKLNIITTTVMITIRHAGVFIVFPVSRIGQLHHWAMAGINGVKYIILDNKMIAAPNNSR